MKYLTIKTPLGWRLFYFVLWVLALEYYCGVIFAWEHLSAPHIFQGYYASYLFQQKLKWVLVLFYLYLGFLAILRFQSFDSSAQKVFVVLFLVCGALWSFTPCFKLYACYVLDSNWGVLSRSPLQNLLSGAFFGLVSKYEPIMCMVLHSVTLFPLDLGAVGDNQINIDAVLFIKQLATASSASFAHYDSVGYSPDFILAYQSLLDHYGNNFAPNYYCYYYLFP